MPEARYGEEPLESSIIVTPLKFRVRPFASVRQQRVAEYCFEEGLRRRRRDAKTSGRKSKKKIAFKRQGGIKSPATAARAPCKVQNPKSRYVSPVRFALREPNCKGSVDNQQNCLISDSDNVTVLFPARDISYSASELVLSTKSSSSNVVSEKLRLLFNSDTHLPPSRNLKDSLSDEAKRFSRPRSRGGMNDPSNEARDKYMNRPPNGYGQKREALNITSDVTWCRNDESLPCRLLWPIPCHDKLEISRDNYRIPDTSENDHAKGKKRKQVTLCISNFGNVKPVDTRKFRRRFFQPATAAPNRGIHLVKNMTRAGRSVQSQGSSPVRMRTSQRKNMYLSDECGTVPLQFMLDKKHTMTRLLGSTNLSKNRPKIPCNKSVAPSMHAFDQSTPEDIGVIGASTHQDGVLSPGPGISGNRSRSGNLSGPTSMSKLRSRPRFSVPIKASLVPMGDLYKQTYFDDPAVKPGISIPKRQMTSSYSKKRIDSQKCRCLSTSAEQGETFPGTRLKEVNAPCQQSNKPTCNLSDRNRVPRVRCSRRYYPSLEEYTAHVFNDAAQKNVNYCENLPRERYKPPAENTDSFPYSFASSQAPCTSSKHTNLGSHGQQRSSGTTDLLYGGSNRLASENARNYLLGRSQPFSRRHFAVNNETLDYPSLSVYRINNFDSGIPRDPMNTVRYRQQPVTPDYIAGMCSEFDTDRFVPFGTRNSRDVCSPSSRSPQIRTDGIYSPRLRSNRAQNPMSVLDNQSNLDTHHSYLLRDARPLSRWITQPETSVDMFREDVFSQVSLPSKVLLPRNVTPIQFRPSVDFSRFEPPPSPPVRLSVHVADKSEDRSHLVNTNNMEASTAPTAAFGCYEVTAPEDSTLRFRKSSNQQKRVKTFGAQVPSGTRLSSSDETSRILDLCPTSDHDVTEGITTTLEQDSQTCSHLTRSTDVCVDDRNSNNMKNKPESENSTKKTPIPDIVCITSLSVEQEESHQHKPESLLCLEPKDQNDPCQKEYPRAERGLQEGTCSLTCPMDNCIVSDYDQWDNENSTDACKAENPKLLDENGRSFWPIERTRKSWEASTKEVSGLNAFASCKLSTVLEGASDALSVQASDLDTQTCISCLSEYPLDIQDAAQGFKPKSGDSVMARKTSASASFRNIFSSIDETSVAACFGNPNVVVEALVSQTGGLDVSLHGTVHKETRADNNTPTAHVSKPDISKEATVSLDKKRVYKSRSDTKKEYNDEDRSEREEVSNSSRHQSARHSIEADTFTSLTSSQGLTEDNSSQNERAKSQSIQKPWKDVEHPFRSFVEHLTSLGPSVHPRNLQSKPTEAFEQSVPTTSEQKGHSVLESKRDQQDEDLHVSEEIGVIQSLLKPSYCKYPIESIVRSLHRGGFKIPRKANTNIDSSKKTANSDELNVNQGTSPGEPYGKSDVGARNLSRDSLHDRVELRKVSPLVGEVSLTSTGNYETRRPSDVNEEGTHFTGLDVANQPLSTSHRVGNVACQTVKTLCPQSLSVRFLESIIDVPPIIKETESIGTFTGDIENHDAEKSQSVGASRFLKNFKNLGHHPPKHVPETVDKNVPTSALNNRLPPASFHCSSNFTVGENPSDGEQLKKKTGFISSRSELANVCTVAMIPMYKQITANGGVFESMTRAKKHSDDCFLSRTFECCRRAASKRQNQGRPARQPNQDKHAWLRFLRRGSRCHSNSKTDSPAENRDSHHRDDEREELHATANGRVDDVQPKQRIDKLESSGASCEDSSNVSGFTQGLSRGTNSVLYGTVSPLFSAHIGILGHTLETEGQRTPINTETHRGHHISWKERLDEKWNVNPERARNQDGGKLKGSAKGSSTKKTAPKDVKPSFGNVHAALDLKSCAACMNSRAQKRGVKVRKVGSTTRTPDIHSTLLHYGLNSMVAPIRTDSHLANQTCVFKTHVHYATNHPKARAKLNETRGCKNIQSEEEKYFSFTDNVLPLQDEHKIPDSDHRCSEKSQLSLKRVKYLRAISNMLSLKSSRKAADDNLTLEWLFDDKRTDKLPLDFEHKRLSVIPENTDSDPSLGRFCGEKLDVSAEFSPCALQVKVLPTILESPFNEGLPQPCETRSDSVFPKENDSCYCSPDGTKCSDDPELLHELTDTPTPKTGKKEVDVSLLETRSDFPDFHTEEISAYTRGFIFTAMKKYMKNHKRPQFSCEECDNIVKIEECKQTDFCSRDNDPFLSSGNTFVEIPNTFDICSASDTSTDLAEDFISPWEVLSRNKKDDLICQCTVGEHEMTPDKPRDLAKFEEEEVPVGLDQENQPSNVQRTSLNFRRELFPFTSCREADQDQLKCLHSDNSDIEVCICERQVRHQYDKKKSSLFQSSEPAHITCNDKKSEEKSFRRHAKRTKETQVLQGLSSSKFLVDTLVFCHCLSGSCHKFAHVCPAQNASSEREEGRLSYNSGCFSEDSIVRQCESCAARASHAVVIGTPKLRQACLRHDLAAHGRKYGMPHPDTRTEGLHCGNHALGQSPDMPLCEYVPATIVEREKCAISSECACVDSSSRDQGARWHTQSKRECGSDMPHEAGIPSFDKHLPTSTGDKLDELKTDTMSDDCCLFHKPTSHDANQRNDGV